MKYNHIKTLISPLHLQHIIAASRHLNYIKTSQFFDSVAHFLRSMLAFYVHIHISDSGAVQRCNADQGGSSAVMTPLSLRRQITLQWRYSDVVVGDWRDAVVNQSTTHHWLLQNRVQMIKMHDCHWAEHQPMPPSAPMFWYSSTGGLKRLSNTHVTTQSHVNDTTQSTEWHL